MCPLGIYENVWYIYRFALESKCGSTEDKHSPETLEKVLEKAEERFKTWKTTAKSDVGIILNDPIWIYNLNMSCPVWLHSDIQSHLCLHTFYRCKKSWVA